MAEHSRIDDLRRRVQKDSASIAFAQLAEELRRAGEYQESADTCRAGLKIHPGYLSARVTLGRALIELGQLDEAQIELSHVLASAPENLAAIRGLAEIHHRHGDLVQALAQYRAALQLARNDPDLEDTIADLSRQVEPAKQAPASGLTLEHMQDELLKLAPKKAEATPVPISEEVLPTSVPSSENPQLRGQVSAEMTSDPISEDQGTGSAASGTPTASADDRATRTVAALEQWLAAIHGSREDRHP